MLEIHTEIFTKEMLGCLKFALKYSNTHTYTYTRQFSLYMVVMFNKITLSSELANAESLRFLQAPGHILINQSTYNLVSPVFLFKDTLFYIS